MYFNFHTTCFMNGFLVFLTVVQLLHLAQVLHFPLSLQLHDFDFPAFLFIPFLWIGNKDPILRLFGVRTGMVGLHKFHYPSLAKVIRSVSRSPCTLRKERQL
ncbi:hypothetical protein S83_046109 [Arachis hypogaea]